MMFVVVVMIVVVVVVIMLVLFLREISYLNTFPASLPMMVKCASSSIIRYVVVMLLETAFFVIHIVKLLELHQVMGLK